MADGKSGTKAAEEVVSRSGDRWGAVYDREEYADFQQALDGEYTGVGLTARRAADGRVEVARVQSGGPAEKAGIEAGDRLRTIDGRRVADRPVTEVVALLRGSERTRVALGMERAGRAWTETLTRATLSTETVTVRHLQDGAVMIRVSSFTKGSGARVRDAVRSAPPARVSCSICAATRAAWSPRPSPRPPPSWTAGSSPRTTYGVSSAPSTRRRAGTPSDPWSPWSTAAR